MKSIFQNNHNINTFVSKKTAMVILTMLMSLTAYSQVAIGKASVSNASVSLEFGTANRGLLLPWVTSASAVAGAVDGTIIFDTNDKKVKYRKNNIWSNLTIDTTGVVDTSLQDALTENSSAKVAIGTNSANDTTPGILVLTDTDKAMILPKVASPHNSISNPSAGMMVYDTTSHLLAVYNGSVWSYWKP